MKLKAIKIVTFFCIQTISCFVFSSEILPINEDAIKQWRQENLTDGELEWLSNHKVIRHGMIQGKIHEPFEYEDSHHKLQGLTSDYLTIIAERLGIKFESNIRLKNRTLLLQSLQNSEINIISYLPKTIAPINNITMSNTIIKMPIVLIARQNSAMIPSIDFIDKERVVIQKGTVVDSMIRENYPNLNVNFVTSPSDGLNAVMNSEADIFIHNAFTNEFYQRKLGFTKLKILAYTDYSYEIVFAVNKDLAPLIHMIEKVIADISHLEKRLIFDKWVNVQVQPSIDLKLIISVVAIIILIALFIVSLVTFWNRRLALEVNSQTNKLRNLARHIERVREEEKSKLAREIHDELGHTLIALSIEIRHLYTEKAESEQKNKKKNLSELVKNASQTSKKIMSDLRPSILEDLGLVSAIEWLVNEFQRTHGITCHYKANNFSFTLKYDVSIALFRIVQESLTNIAKHAQASQVNINLFVKKSTLMMLIYDNGIGLIKPYQQKEHSYGLIGIEERVLALGGKITITSADKEGVQILIKVPINNLI